jgi:hypothetical protein
VIGALLVLGVAGLATRQLPRGRALRGVGACVAAAALGGGFWYGRNLILARNPLAPAHLPGTPRPDLSGLTGFDNSVLHFVGVGGLFPHALYKQLPSAWGHLWWVLILGALVLPAGTALLAGQRRARLLGVAAVLGAAAYLITPSGAAGTANGNSVFGINVRYLLPAVALGFLAVGADRSERWRRTRTASLAAVTTLLAVNDLLPSSLPSRPGTSPRDDLALAAGAIFVTTVVVLVAGRPRLRLAGFGVLAVVLAGTATALGIHTEHTQPVAFSDLNPGPTLDAMGIRNVSYVGTALSFVAFNRDLARQVEPLGVHTGYGGLSAVTSCAQVRSVVLADHAQAVVLVLHSYYASSDQIVHMVEQAFPSVAASGPEWQILRVTAADTCVQTQFAGRDNP